MSYFKSAYKSSGTFCDSTCDSQCIVGPNPTNQGVTDDQCNACPSFCS